MEAEERPPLCRWRCGSGASSRRSRRCWRTRTTTPSPPLTLGRSPAPPTAGASVAAPGAWVRARRLPHGRWEHADRKTMISFCLARDSGIVFLELVWTHHCERRKAERGA
ncbi:unnamed protein product, partial [Phaeothamnion confervicola]